MFKEDCLSLNKVFKTLLVYSLIRNKKLTKSILVTNKLVKDMFGFLQTLCRLDGPKKKAQKFSQNVE